MAATQTQRSRTAQRAIDAYGGEERWRAARTVEATGTLTGFLFRMKSCLPVPNARIRCEVQRPWTRIAPIDRAGHAGVYNGRDVWLETAGGTPVAIRRGARGYFHRDGKLTGREALRRQFHWDALDLTYFLGYAIWSYLALPAILLRDDVAWDEVEDGLLEPRYPAHIPVHGPRQRLWFDRETGLLRRYDYHVEIVHPRAPNVANVVAEHGEGDGIPYEAHRIVTAAPDGETPLKHPVFVDMRFWDWQLR